VLGMGVQYTHQRGLATLLQYRTQMTDRWNAESTVQLGMDPSFTCAIHRPLQRQVVDPSLPKVPSSSVLDSDESESQVLLKLKFTPKGEKDEGLLSLTYPLMEKLDLFLGINFHKLSLGLIRSATSDIQYGFKVVLGYQHSAHPLDLHLFGSYMGHRLVVPLHLFRGPSAQQIAYSFLFPFLGWCLTHQLVQAPLQCAVNLYWDRMNKREYEKNWERHQQAAHSERQLMTSTVERQLRREKGDGVVIISAWYGALFSPRGQGARPNVIDVRVPLQFWVENGTLSFPLATPKWQLDGFYDPCYGEEKWLLIHYQVDHKDHYVMVDDEEPFMLPCAAHQKNTESRQSLLQRIQMQQPASSPE